MTPDFKVTVLVSGRGSNLQALVAGAGRYRISAVISNNPDSAGLTFAKAQKIPCQCVDRRAYGSLAEFKSALLDAVTSTEPHLVALAGFMVVLSAEFTDTFHGRLVNIHPSLLPKFPGLDTHERAFAAGESVHGCTVHYVDAGVDTGPIIAQAEVGVEAEDSIDQLKARVLEREHQIYPWVISSIAQNNISLNDRHVVYSTGARAEARLHGFRIVT